MLAGGGTGALVDECPGRPLGCPHAPFAQPALEAGKLEAQQHRWCERAPADPLLRGDLEPEAAAIESDVPGIDFDEDVGDLAPAQHDLADAPEERSDHGLGICVLRHREAAELADPPAL